MNTSTEHRPQDFDDRAVPPRRSDGSAAAKVLLALVSIALVAWCALTVVSLLGRDTQRRSETYDNVSGASTWTWPSRASPSSASRGPRG